MEKMSDKKISVIIPAYNTESFLEKCVNSVAEQTYPKELLEIIIVDDGSTDSTGQVADNLAKKYSNIKVIHQPNGGSSNARNHGLREATGDYIGFVDSDDFLSPNAYKELMEAIEETGAQMAQMGRDEIAETGERLPDVVPPVDKLTVISSMEHMRTLLMHTGDASYCTKLTARTLFDGSAPEAENNFQNNDLHKSEDGSQNNDSHKAENSSMEIDSHKSGNSSMEIDFHKPENGSNEINSNSTNLIFPEGILNEDFYLMIHMLQKIDKLVVIPGQYYHVFYRTGSNSRKKAEDKDFFPRVFTDIVDNSAVAEKIVYNTWPELKEIAIRFGLYQRLDYMLHIPISKMTSDNTYYRGVVKYLRGHIGDTITNKYLTKKNKIYLLLLSIAPRTVRKAHAKSKGWD